ncbi:MAG TPA: site-specific integrase [Xanthobacteraceae bacterium]|nr:site-specific integrase [Xanthobacteraceae bacterium]
MKGHVRERGKGNWYAVLSVRDPATGKRKVKWISLPKCKGKRAAENECGKIVQQMNGGNYIDSSKITVADFLDKWMLDYAAPNVSPKTRERYGQLIKNQIKPGIGQVELQKLRPVHLTGLYAKLLGDEQTAETPATLKGAERGGLSARTVNHVHRLLHIALGHAGTWELVKQNIAAFVSPPKVDDVEIVILTPEQIGRVLIRVQGITLKPIVELALATGARRGELLALRLGDFDPTARTMRIERALEQTKAGLRIKPPKTRHGRRTISLPPTVANELRAHIARVQERRLALGMGRAGDDDLLFPRFDGQIRSPRWLTKKFAMLMQALKIDGVTFHSLRHTHASQLIASGMDVLTISRRLGHGSPTITLKVYGHLFGNTDARAAEIMEATFSGLRTE